MKIRGFGIILDSNRVVVAVVSSFTCKLGDWASDQSSEIYEMKTMDELIYYVRVSFSIKNIEGENIYSVVTLKQGELSLHDYAQEFNNSYACWKGPIVIKAAVYMHIVGHKNGCLCVYLMKIWQTVE